LPSPNANPITAEIRQQVHDAALTERPGESDLVRRIRTACLNSPNGFPVAAGIASRLRLSLCTFRRRCPTRDSYQSIVDGIRRSLATELLENTHLGVDLIAERIGFADATSFRKAFKKRTNRSPSDFRRSRRNA
jgi:AraC-like DNA-binding protein